MLICAKVSVFVDSNIMPCNNAKKYNNDCARDTLMISSTVYMNGRLNAVSAVWQGIFHKKTGIFSCICISLVSRK